MKRIFTVLTGLIFVATGLWSQALQTVEAPYIQADVAFVGPGTGLTGSAPGLTTGDLSAILGELSSTTSASLGQGLIGFNPALSYPLGTLPGDLASPLYGDALVAVLQPFTGATARNQGQKNADFVSATDFGADPTGVADSTNAINSALADALWAFLPAGTYKTTGTITIPVGGKLTGAGRSNTSIVVSADVLGILMSGQDELGSLSITKSGTHTNNLIDVGNAAGTIGAGRDSLYNLLVSNAGQDGICIRNGNCGSLRDVTVNTCTRDGINFTTATANANAWTTSGYIDLNTNGRDGDAPLYGVKCWSHQQPSRPSS